ncbi:MAG TPA: hypothetical protein VE988_08885 [Gemmataceae bacterium]|nr:hypothetical protein [Gemmataceae bacterium]
MHLADDLPKTKELHRVLGPTLMSCIIPISGSVQDRTVQYGTGTLFRAGDFSFLVTAGHVLRKVKEDKALLRLLDGKNGDEVRSVAIPKLEAYLGDEPADVAVLPLGDEVVAALPNRTFLRLDEVALRASRPGGCWVMGYPAETVVHGEVMIYKPFLIAAPFIDPLSSMANFDPGFNFLLDVKRDELWWPDGTPANMPDRLEGISGCPIWQVVWPDGWHPELVRIVGVQVGYYRTRSAFKATHWGAVAELLSHYQPGLQGILTMHFGRL